jgi:2-polyprenyl-3-methyl-5-hydroxy-6-metoxy-1,4-benzoquinol methylase
VVDQSDHGKTIEEVKSFWEAHPLWTGESQYPIGSSDFFDEHRRVVIGDTLAGEFDERLIPPPRNRAGVLDLGCGPGFWTVELGRLGCTDLVAADLTDAAIAMARARCTLFDVAATFCRENAESLSFESGRFAHVNCQGVIHHTPGTEACVREIARVLKRGGTASVSVYYTNVLVRMWPALQWPARCLVGRIRLRGRGREQLLVSRTAAEMVRQYDGAANPIGKAYSRGQFVAMLSPHFIVRETFLHCFPIRALPFEVPRPLHRWLDRTFGFMIYASLIKR